ncbi:hypothetical protein MID08_09175 [Pseudomonas entomophila]|nr:hypothetical protein [Pseudomonas entomophila]MCG8293026.1 hypothetical protein [Pseudomonas entomophila]
MIWAWLAILAAGVSSWLIFRDPEAPVTVRLHPHHIVRRELSEGSKNTFTEHLVAVGVFDKQLLVACLDDVVNHIVLVDARIALNLQKHPLCHCAGVHQLPPGAFRSNDASLK